MVCRLHSWKDGNKTREVKRAIGGPSVAPPAHRPRCSSIFRIRYGWWAVTVVGAVAVRPAPKPTSNRFVALQTLLTDIWLDSRSRDWQRCWYAKNKLIFIHSFMLNRGNYWKGNYIFWKYFSNKQCLTGFSYYAQNPTSRFPMYSLFKIAINRFFSIKVFTQPTGQIWVDPLLISPFYSDSDQKLSITFEKLAVCRKVR